MVDVVTVVAEVPLRGEPRWKVGDFLRKKAGSSWKGQVVGLYSTHLTRIGYAIESSTEVGSVQIYPESALESWLP